MTIFFCGDPHGQFKHIINAAKAHKPAACVLLGDNLGEADTTKSLRVELASIWDMTEIYFIHGNHEHDFEVTSRLIDEDQDCNISGKVIEIDGLRIAGLGGVFRGTIWAPPAEPGFHSYDDYKLAAMLKRPPRLKHDTTKIGEDRKHLASIFPDVYERLYLTHADILVTHEAPSCHRHGFAALDELAQALRAKRCFHGHHHDNLDYSAHWDALGFLAYGVGLRGISDQDGNVIVPGELDNQRNGRMK